MRSLEPFGLGLALLVLVGTPAGVLAGQRSFNSDPGVHTVVAHIAEDGGFIPAEIIVRQGEHVKLRLTSADVTHGLIAKGLNMNVPAVYPGKYVAVEFTPDKPGRYPFVCATMCSLHHGDMKGTIVVLPAT